MQKYRDLTLLSLLPTYLYLLKPVEEKKSVFLNLLVTSYQQNVNVDLMLHLKIENRCLLFKGQL
jgi:hypothetical protein